MYEIILFFVLLFVFGDILGIRIELTRLYESLPQNFVVGDPQDSFCLFTLCEGKTSTADQEHVSGSTQKFSVSFRTQ